MVRLGGHSLGTEIIQFSSATAVVQSGRPCAPEIQGRKFESHFGCEFESHFATELLQCIWFDHAPLKTKVMSSIPLLHGTSAVPPGRASLTLCKISYLR